MTVTAIARTPSSRRWLAWGLWLTLTVVLLLAMRNLAWADILQRLSQVRLAWIAAAVAANFAILPLWAAEWRLLVPAAFAVTYRRMFGIVAVTASVLNSVPFFAGEASAVGLLIARAGLSRSAAASVLALDQLLVALAKLATLAAAASLVALPGWLRGGIWSLVAGFTALLAALGVLAHSWQRLHDWFSRGAGRIRSLIASVVAWGRHLDAIRDPRRGAAAIILALLKKAAEIAAVMATQVALGLDPSLPAAVLVVAALAVTTLLPVSPANLGVYEATVFATYRYLGAAADAAIGLAVVQHVCFLLPSMITGYGVATLAQLRPRARPTSLS